MTSPAIGIPSLRAIFGLVGARLSTIVTQVRHLPLLQGGETTEDQAVRDCVNALAAVVDTLPDSAISRIKLVAHADTPYLATTAYDSFLILATGGRITLTLPVAPVTGQRFTIYDDGYAGTGNRFTIDGNGKKIEAANTVEVDKNFACWMIEYDGTRWHRIAWIGGSPP